MLRVLSTALFLLLPGLAQAAASAQPLTPVNTSVLGGERQVYSVRFFDGLGRPSAGETVTFGNDACGFFDNGGFSATAVTDATGVASVGFTARAQGITCWIVAQAGVRVTFNVFTYTLGQVALAFTTFPAEPRYGQPSTLTVQPFAGAYPIYGATPTVRVVPEGAATLTLQSVDEAGKATYTVSRTSPNVFDVEASYRGVTRRTQVAAAPSPFQDMWWGGAGENGWGMSVVQHGERLFVAIYAYDAAGAPTWYVMPGGTWNAQRTAVSGALYSPRGTPYTAYDASKLVVGAAAGSATISFEGASEAVLEYTIGNTTGRKTITRQLFGPAESIAAPLQAGDMWWGGSEQNGWGLALLQQHRTLFGVWFTYDANGAPTWFVMPSGFWADAQTWQGRIYRATGAPWAGQAYDPSRLVTTEVGGFSLRFAGDSATLTFTIDGKPGTMALVRQAF